SGVKVIASSVASNLKECAPHASMHSSKLSDSAKAEWEKYYRSAVLESSTNCSEAIKEFRRAAGLDAEYAELQFRLARCLTTGTNLTEARQAFELARDYDALPFRTTSALNRITRETAGKHKNVSFFDAEKVLSESSTNLLPGNDLFF